MKLAYLLAAALLLAGCQNPVSTVSVAARKAAPVSTRQVTHPTLLIKFKATPRAQELGTFRAQFGLRNVGKIEGLGIFIEEPAGDVDLGALLDALNANPLVEFAELNGRVDLQI
jgi:uncharacterized lipoprotein YajG